MVRRAPWPDDGGPHVPWEHVAVVARTGGRAAGLQPVSGPPEGGTSLCVTRDSRDIDIFGPVGRGWRGGRRRTNGTGARVRIRPGFPPPDMAHPGASARCRAHSGAGMVGALLANRSRSRFDDPVGAG